MWIILVLCSYKTLEVVLCGIHEVSKDLAPAPFVAMRFRVEFSVSERTDAGGSFIDGFPDLFRDCLHSASVINSSFTISNSTLRLSIMKSWRSGVFFPI